MSEVALFNGNLTTTGLRLSADTTYEEFSTICYVLGQLHEAVRFAIGDAINDGPEILGDEAYQALELLNLSEDARWEYSRVARKVPRSIRHKTLSWSHHRAVASLPYPEQRLWLARARDEQLSHHALRDALRSGDGPTGSTAALPPVPGHTCECCGRSL